MTNVDFKISHHQVAPVPAGEAAQLALHLAFFAPREHEVEWRALAAKVAVAIEIAAGGTPEPLELTDSQRQVIVDGVTAMLDARAGNVSVPLVDLRDACIHTDT